MGRKGLARLKHFTCRGGGFRLQLAKRQWAWVGGGCLKVEQGVLDTAAKGELLQVPEQDSDLLEVLGAGTLSYSS